MSPKKDDNIDDPGQLNDDHAGAAVLSKDIIGTLKEVSETLTSLDRESGEFREIAAKATEDLKTELASQRTEIGNLTDQVTVLAEKDTEENPAASRKFWDAVGGDEMAAKAVSQMWGYGAQPNADDEKGPGGSAFSGKIGSALINKSMYQPKVKYVRQKGLMLKGTYDLTDDVMRMNDVLVIWGLSRSQLRTGGYNPQSYREAITKTDTYKLLRYELSRIDPEYAKALDTATSGEGAEWVPTQFSAQFIDEIRLQLRVAALFQRLQIPDRTGSFVVPGIGDRKTAYLTGQSKSDTPTNITSTTPSTRDVTFTAVKHAVMIRWSDEIDEDSAVAIAPIVLAEIQQAIADGEEESIISGDADGTHFDTGSNISGGTDVRESYTGLRKHSGHSAGNAAVDISTLNTTALRSMRKKMGRYGVIPTDNAWVVSITMYIQMLGLTEVLTLDKYGSAFTALNGELGRFDGSPIIVSEFMREDLNATGIHDGVTETKTAGLLVNTRAFWIGDKGQPRTESDRDIKIQQSYTVASRRIDFQQVTRVAASGEESVAVGYNLTS